MLRQPPASLLDHRTDHIGVPDKWSLPFIPGFSVLTSISNSRVNNSHPKYPIQVHNKLVAGGHIYQVTQDVNCLKGINWRKVIAEATNMFQMS